MRDSHQRALKVGCVEIPVPVGWSKNKPEVKVGYTPPLQLLSLAAAAKEANCEVEQIPSDVWWPPQSSGSESEVYSLGAARILSHRPDLIVTVVNGFSWPVAAKLLAALAQASGEYRPRVVVGGINSPERLQAISKKGLADALFCAGDEDSFKRFLADEPQPLARSVNYRSSARQSVTFYDSHKFPKVALINQALLSSISQLRTWPRWEKGLANIETYGFPLDNQAHPWNLPAVSAPSLAETEEWLRRVTPFLRTLREPLLWLSMTSDSWSKDAMELIGEFALTVLKEYGVSPIFGIRATVSEILTPSVLASLAMLQVRRIDLLVGSGTDSSLQRYDAQCTTQQIEQAVKEIKRAGLATKTRLQSVISMPEEDLNEALETVRLTARLATENSIPEIKYEWWCNVPDSLFYQTTPSWEEVIYDQPGVWFLDENLLNKAPSIMAPENRRVVKETLEFLRILYAKVRVIGPSLL